MEYSLAVPQKVKHRLPQKVGYDPAIPVLGIYPEELKTYGHTSVSNIIHNSPKVETPKCSPTDGQTKCSITTQQNTIQPTWMNLENIILSERSQLQKCMIPFG